MKRKAESATAPEGVGPSAKKHKKQGKGKTHRIASGAALAEDLSVQALAETGDFGGFDDEIPENEAAATEAKDKKKSKKSKDRKRKSGGDDDVAEAEVQEQAGDEEAKKPEKEKKKAKKDKAGKAEKESKKDKANKADKEVKKFGRKADDPTSTAPADGAAEGKKHRFIVFIGNLPYTATQATVEAHFAALRPAAVRLLTDQRDKTRCRGVAFVEFADHGPMKTCLDKYHHSEFSDGLSPARKINVELTYVVPTHSPSGPRGPYRFPPCAFVC